MSILLCIVLIVPGQRIQREKVVVEIGTGTWCPYCPGSAMGADELVENGHDVAIIEYHSGDDYENVYSSTRVNYYGVPGYPTAYFDGLLPYVGGSSTQSMYPQYLPRVNNRIGVTSPFTIGVTGTTSGLIDFNIEVTVEKVGTNNSANLKLHTVVTESGIEEFWQGQDHLNYVCRLMVPNQNGTAVSFASGNVQTYQIQFSLNPEWVPENCELVVFVQDHSTKEIHQAVLYNLTDFGAAFENDAAMKEISSIPSEVCSGTIAPVVTIRNHGNAPITSLDIYYSMNKGAYSVLPWSGNLAYLEMADVPLPAISYEVGDDNELKIYSSNPNGNPDEFPSNDTIVRNIPKGSYTPSAVNLIVRTDANPQETTWELKNSAGDVLYSGGPYSSSGQMIMEEFELSEVDCYSFNMIDAGGNGLANPGFYMLYYGTNTVIIQGTTFGAEDMIEFTADNSVGIIDTKETSSLLVFPNPATDLLNIDLSGMKEAGNISIFSMDGRKVWSEEFDLAGESSNVRTIDMTANKSGIYVVRVVSGNSIYTEKVTLNR